MAIAEGQVYMPQAPRPRLRLLEDERWLAFVLLVPTMVLLGLFIAYPFVRGILLSVTDSRVGVPGNFVGLANFYKIWNDSIFRTSVYNTFVYTGVTTVFKLALGLWLAMLLNRNFRGKAFTRAFILLPFIIPTVLSTFAWKWMFDPTFSVLNWLLYHFSLITGRINWLGDPDLAMTSIIIVNIWRGVPFFAISLLAGLQTISPELNEAAAIDGARPWNRSEEHTSELQSPCNLVCRLLLEKKKNNYSSLYFRISSEFICSQISSAMCFAFCCIFSSSGRMCSSSASTPWRSTLSLTSNGSNR